MNSTHDGHLKDIPVPFVSLSFDPVLIEIRKHPADEASSNPVTRPFGIVVSQLLVSLKAIGGLFSEYELAARSETKWLTHIPNAFNTHRVVPKNFVIKG